MPRGCPGDAPGDPPGIPQTFVHDFNLNEFLMEKNNIGLKRVAVGAIGLLNNEPGSHFRGGADALGPEVALCLTYFIKKTYNFSKMHFYYQNDAELWENSSQCNSDIFAQVPGSKHCQKYI